MKFVDTTVIYVRSGRGGNGIVAFRREKNLPFGGPAGGDGGNGGSVILRANENCDTLLPLARSQRHVAKNGEAGQGNNRQGKSATDIVVEVPVGTQITYAKPLRKVDPAQDGYDKAPNEEDDEAVRTGLRDTAPQQEEQLVADLTTHMQEVVVVRGGKGGYGNKRFATAINQAPDECTPGEWAEEALLRLELKLIADVGLVGFPNAGKSTLLSRLSAARPKIADYPFTTMQPQLGIVSSGYGHELVMADIPGIIENAAEGAGMGVEFLRHVERCRFLLHLVNLGPIDGTYPWDNYHAINRELQKFSPILAGKPQIIVGNKLDLKGTDDALEILREEAGVPVFGISAVSGEGLKELTRELFRMMQEHPRPTD